MLSSSSLKERGTFPIHHRQGVFTFLPAWAVISNGGGAGFQEEPALSFFFCPKKSRNHFFFPSQVLGSIRVAELQMRQLFPNILSGKSFHNNGNHMKAPGVAPPTIEESFQLSGLHIGLHK